MNPENLTARCCEPFFDDGTRYGIPPKSQRCAHLKRRFGMSCSLIQRFLRCAVLISFIPAVASAQNTEAKAPPVLDVHVHAMDGTFPGVAPMCPNTSKFTA